MTAMRGPRARLSERSAAAPVVLAFDRRVAAHALPVVELIFIGERVHEPGAAAPLRRETALRRERPHVLDALLAALGDAADELLVHVAIERVAHLAMGGSEGAFGQLVRRGLVVADVLEVGVRADLVERPAKKHR